MSCFNYEKVTTLQEAFQSISTSPGDAVIMAGGTDLLLQIRDGTMNPQRVIDIKGVVGLDTIDFTNEACLIGAVTRIRTLETSQKIKARLPLLAQAASTLGSIQVRNRATVGGNLCNAAPSADMAPALLVLDTRVEIDGEAGRREVALSDFFRGPGLTALHHGEILTGLKIPLSNNYQGAVYHKLTIRKAMDLAIVGVAVLLELDDDNLINISRVALGAVAPTPLRVPSAEQHIGGKQMSADLAREAAQIAMQFCQPITDLRASAEYRREMVGALCQRGLLEAYEKAINSRQGDKR